MIGLTHTLSSLNVCEALRRIPSAPIFPWDALICTSRAAQQALTEALDHQAALLASRFGGTVQAWQRPQLPIIPLGCDVQRFLAWSAPNRRLEARRSWMFAPEQVVLLCVGRLELYAKAHPGVLFQALARVCQQRAMARPNAPPPCLLVVGTAQSETTARAWQQSIQHFSPWFELRLVNGYEDELTASAWSAADVFVSLADSLQETFVLTSVEAMACGLPVIASDWNGYCDAIIHEQTGLFIPAIQPSKQAVHRLVELALSCISLTFLWLI